MVIPVLSLPVPSFVIFINLTVPTEDSAAATATIDPGRRGRQLPQLLQHHRIEASPPLTDECGFYNWKIDHMIHNLPANIHYMCKNKELQKKASQFGLNENTWKDAECSVLEILFSPAHRASTLDSSVSLTLCSGLVFWALILS